MQIQKVHGAISKEGHELSKSRSIVSFRKNAIGDVSNARQRPRISKSDKTVCQSEGRLDYTFGNMALRATWASACVV
jgi:hypothetical protein